MAPPSHHFRLGAELDFLVTLYILWFGLAIILYAKHFQILGEIGWLARVVYFNDPARAMNASGAGRHGWAPMNSANLYGNGESMPRSLFASLLGGQNLGSATRIHYHQ